MDDGQIHRLSLKRRTDDSARTAVLGERKEKMARHTWPSVVIWFRKKSGSLSSPLQSVIWIGVANSKRAALKKKDTFRR